MARRFKSRRRRRTRVVWFAPRTSTLNTDAFTSCFADEGVGFFPKGSTSSPRGIISPIIGNITQALSPDADPTLSEHPLAERWTVQRIVGDVAVQAVSTQQLQLAHDGVDIHMGIYRSQSIGDAVLDYDPTQNQECLMDWLWMTHFSMSCAEITCHDCPVDETTNSQPPVETTGDIGSAVTGFQVFGVPSLTWTHVDVKVKRRVEPEHGLWLAVYATVGASAVDRVALSCEPKLRVLLSRTV